MTQSYATFKRECSKEIELLGSDENLKILTRQWMNRANTLKYSYHFEWLGRPIIQYPQDMVIMQELIWNTKPDLIIETGIAHGGSLILNASMLAMLDMCDAINSGSSFDPNKPSRMVLGVDIDIRPHNLAAIEAHPMASRISMLQGSSIAEDIIQRVHDFSTPFKRILVCLDSNHTNDHVLAELKAYAPLTTTGSYCVVFDTVIDDMPDDMFPNRPWGSGNNPKTAVQHYLQEMERKKLGSANELTPQFEIDYSIDNQLLVTVAPGGFLKRVA